jgi:BirA family transcriptional regulator, biotin operon repressor / biotin---[acetyl-CoA-carboxylase] ligase
MVTAMTGDHARSLLEGTRFDDLRWVVETGSTNDDLLGLARTGAAEGTVLVADTQRAGRGRLGRTWQAPPGSSLLVSVLLRPALDPGQAHLVATAVACAAAEACSEVTSLSKVGVEPSLKWPNDLLVESPTGGRTGKLGGILAESIVEGDRLEAVVVGLGLNVNWPDDLPPDLDGIAVAVNHLTGEPVDREVLLAAVLRALESRVDGLGSVPGREQLLVEYRRRCSTIGSRVRVELAHESFTGEAVAISADGHLVVEGADGGRREVTAGDVVHLRGA